MQALRMPLAAHAAPEDATFIEGPGFSEKPGLF